MARRGTARIKKAAKHRRESQSSGTDELSDALQSNINNNDNTHDKAATDEHTTETEAQSSYQSQHHPTLEEYRPSLAEPDHPAAQAYIRDVFGAPITDTRPVSNLIQVAAHSATNTLAQELFPSPQRNRPIPFVVSGFESTVSQTPETGAAQSTSPGAQGTHAILPGSTELPRNRNRRSGKPDRVIASVEQASRDSPPKETDSSAPHLQHATNMSSTNPATQMRHLRACMVCSLVRTTQDFMRSGCLNCESFLELTGNMDTIQECTSQVYEGLMTVMDTSGRSWVVRHQRLEGYAPGMYATQVEGVLPEEVAIAAENAGVHYIPRDGSSNEAIPDEQ